MFALVDCNNFFVSCERVFNPKLRQRPVAVLSYNDGCVVSRSEEVKKLGIPMGVPLFKMADLVRQHRIVVLSSNFSIYGNLSDRIMHIIRRYAEHVEEYSIDEAFINLTGIQDKVGFCQKLARRIERYTGVPVSIGIGSTRTLAKAANHIAKKQQVSNKVFFLDDLRILEKLLVRDIWGIGSKLEKRLHALGVHTAYELTMLPDLIIKQDFNRTLLMTVRELRGISVISIRDHAVNKDQIMVSRSFGHRVTDLASMQQAITTYASSACSKLRRQNLVTGGICVFLHTSLHGANVYDNSSYVLLPGVTNDTRVIIDHAKQTLAKLFRPGYQYKKVGIILSDLAPAAKIQFDIFEHQNLDRSEQLMRMIDGINKNLGSNTIQFAAAGFTKHWRVKSENCTPNYTGSWQELPEVKITEI